MSNWQDHPEVDPTIIQGLIDAVGHDAFSGMRDQFVTDLRSLAEAYKQAHAGADFDQARAHAHALKGAAANIGLVQLSVIAGQLERDGSDPGSDLAAILDRSIVRLEAAS
ncbi:hypothetical protein AWH62_00130 [Maricaulis sp. W15]|uniref:Hpt domain-containing protein n=1 Tax=Maricaulis maris TaxID=74318 RepID=A0A495D3J0_9PROT|nr:MULTISPECIES: Hpt domain-containing protein [Maricaulis]OLF81121.1 hypothetical protein AWH62_00130 [Maricaulis sp. W15]RKQ96476.1 Hpt domain-containing protein [Maricaulis maris]